MTREEIDRLVAQYTDKTFDEIEDILALEWERPGLDQYSWDLNDRAHEISGALADADPRSAMELARRMAPDAPEDALRKLARRLMEVELLGIKRTLSALNGGALLRPRTSYQPPSVPQTTPKVSLRVSELAKLYGDERVARKNWSDRTEFQMRGYLSVLANLLEDPSIAEITKDDMRRLGLDLISLPSNLSKRFPGKTPREALEAARSDENVARGTPPLS